MSEHQPYAGMRLDPRPKYLSLTLTAVQQGISYRGATFLNLLSSLIWVGMLYALWQTVFASRAELSGWSWQEMQSYVIVAFVLNALLPFQTIGRMTYPVRTGQIAIDLVRPLDFLLMQLARSIGMAAVEGVASGVVIWLLGVVVLGIALPASPLLATLFVLSVVLGFVLKFLLCFLVALICFHTINPLGLVWMFTAIASLLSGTLVPLQFFPSLLRTLALATPFSGIVYLPLQIYLGQLGGGELLMALAFQLVWIVLLWALARLLWSWSARALEIQGG